MLCDSCVWLALVLSQHRHHRAALDWLATVDRPRAVCFCRATQQTLLRLVTTPAIMRLYSNPPLTNRQAWELYERILDDERIVFCANEPSRLEARWMSLALGDTASPKAWMDTYLAAFALASGMGFVTIDRAFRSFSGLDLTLLGEQDEALANPIIHQQLP